MQVHLSSPIIGYANRYAHNAFNGLAKARGMGAGKETGTACFFGSHLDTGPYFWPIQVHGFKVPELKPQSLPG